MKLLKWLGMVIFALALAVLFAWSSVEAFDQEQARYEQEGHAYSALIRQGTEGKQ